MYNVVTLYQLFYQQSIREDEAMKKVLIYLMPVLTFVFVAFIIGLFYGRQSATAVQLTPSADVAVTETQYKAITDGKININTASATQLTYVPGIGDVTAQRIVEYREEHGNYQTINDLLNVEGFGPKKIEQIAPYITAGGSQ